MSAAITSDWRYGLRVQACFGGAAVASSPAKANAAARCGAGRVPACSAACAVSRRAIPRQARFLTWASLRWVVRHRAWSRFYLAATGGSCCCACAHPHIVTEGFVFIGRRVELYARRGYGRLVVGRWVHLGDENRLRAHEGTLRVGDKVVLGRDNTVNCYLDVEIGDATIVADWVYVCDFDHVYEDINVPIKDQGIVKSPVRIGPDCWVGDEGHRAARHDGGRGVRARRAHGRTRRRAAVLDGRGRARQGAQGPARGLRGRRGQAPRPRRHRRQDRARRRAVGGLNRSAVAGP